MFAAENRSFDPVKIFEAIEKAGFSLPKVEVTASGIIEDRNGILTIQIPEQPTIFVLHGGSKLSEFEEIASTVTSVRITGLVSRPDGDAPSTLSVEKYEVLESL